MFPAATLKNRSRDQEGVHYPWNMFASAAPVCAYRASA